MARPRSILWVDDEIETLDSQVLFLEQQGFTVERAANGEDALKLAEQHHAISLLLTDVVMPGINGRKLADEVNLRLPQLKVLYMTGYSRNDIVH